MTQVLTKPNGTVRWFLGNLVLIADSPMSPDVKEAEQELRKLFEDVYPDAKLEFWSASVTKFPAPTLFVNGSLYRGLSRIKQFTELVRDCAR